MSLAAVGKCLRVRDFKVQRVGSRAAETHNVSVESGPVRSRRLDAIIPGIVESVLASQRS